MRLIDGDELYQKVVGYNGGAVDKTVAKRLIDQMPTIDAVSRQAAIDAMEQAKEQYFDRTVIIGKMQDIVNNLPSAQPEIISTPSYTASVGEPMEYAPIVRCKDCKHYYYADNRIPQEQRYVCDLDGDRWKPEDFCSYAERRTDELGDS